MITSMANQQVKQLVQLQKKAKAREEQGVFLAEGIRMFEETPKDRIRKIYLSESCYKKRGSDMDLSGCEVEVLSDTVFSHVSDTQTPQGVLCIVNRKQYTLPEVAGGESPLLLVLDNLQDPGNLGTIMRTAEGAGVTGVLMSHDCVDIYNPKVIRSTMGSVYRVPFLYTDDLAGVIRRLSESGICTYAAHLDGKNFYDEENYQLGTAFLIGNEGNGLRDEIAAAAQCKIKIPMHGQLESLNAAVAASILMYEACRQRR